MMDIESELRGSPYLMAADSASLKRFNSNQHLAMELRDRAAKENARIRTEATDLLQPYIEATRTDLVSESNVIEGYMWTPEETREVILKNREILDGSVRSLVRSFRDDSRVYEVLGLYKAHEIADEWTNTDRAPSAHEIRELHNLIIGDPNIGGRYKVYPNEIVGSDLRTAAPFDVPRLMLELSDWWQYASEDPVLSATVVHAWLVHIHPFEDGNGRLARVLANLELSRNGYPPLVLRAQSDRGEYYSALAQSDDGDLLPLYELFVRAVRRQVRAMASPDYVRDLIADRFLSNTRERYKMWMASLELFSSELALASREVGEVFTPQGMPTIHSFSLLAQRSPEGNGWFATLGGRYESEWLLWFGFRSDELSDLNEKDFAFPSIFISRRDRSDDAPHPFTRDYNRSDLPNPLPDEVSVFPGRHDPVCSRTGFRDEWMSYRGAARSLVNLLTDRV